MVTNDVEQANIEILFATLVPVMVSPAHNRELTRIIRVFVSSPSDVFAERGALDELVRRINSTQAADYGVRFELHKWETDVVPQIGPVAQQVVNSQLPPCDVFLGVMWGRFGTPTGGYGSGTEEEFRNALARWAAEGAPWILFYFRGDPPKINSVTDSRQYTQVLEFKEELRRNGLVGDYQGIESGPDAFIKKVDTHLRSLIKFLGNAELAPAVPRQLLQASLDTAAYLRWLLSRTAFIDIRGLQVGSGKAYRFPIEELFVTLNTLSGSTAQGTYTKVIQDRQHRLESDVDQGPLEALVFHETVPLHEALRYTRLVVLGDPGSGKTTFLNRVITALCKTRLGVEPTAAGALGFGDEGTVSGHGSELDSSGALPFPLYIRIADVAEFVTKTRASGGHRHPIADGTAWLANFLEQESVDNACALSADFFHETLVKGPCLLVVDGLDEAPDRVTRESLVQLIENASVAFPRTTIVVTSRPGSYVAKTILPGFVQTRIAPLNDGQIATFLRHWCSALYLGHQLEAEQHRSELAMALEQRPEIRRMVRTPVMLTALAVVHWNERRLPEQRADLYESVVTWLSRSREQLPDRPAPERALALLSELALAMQTDVRGRQTQLGRREAAETIASEWRDEQEPRRRIAAAERFLDAEELDSGIVVRRGGEVAFWHLTFQEFLAARALAGRPDTDQWRRVSQADRLYRPEWREVVLLLAGLLHRQGRGKVDQFVNSILAGVSSGTLAAKAQAVGLIGTMVRDLAPFDYEPSDRTYKPLLEEVRAIFDPVRAPSVPLVTRIEAAEVLGRAGDIRLDPASTDRAILVPAGSFFMGSQNTEPDGRNYDARAFLDEAPVREVELDGYAIGRYPVTVVDFLRFIEDDGYKDERWWTAGGNQRWMEPGEWSAQLEYPNRPVVRVSWYEARAFAAWAGGRLPTEAEWERAARDQDGRVFPWGNEPCDSERLNCESSGIGRATPVGVFVMGVGPGGIQDMAGNVLDWCSDWWHPDYYAKGPRGNPEGPTTGDRHVVRGGCWSVDSRCARSSCRLFSHPDNRYDSLGFRVVWAPGAKIRIWQS